MNYKLLKNMYFCIALPMFVSGVTALGYFILIKNISIEARAFFSGMVGYLIGAIVRLVYKWE